jgi:hypothetical protein
MSFEIKPVKKVEHKPAGQKTHKIFQAALEEDDDQPKKVFSKHSMPFLATQLAKANEEKVILFQFESKRIDVKRS